MTIHNLEIEQELELLSSDSAVRPRSEFRAKTILVKVLRFTLSNEVNYFNQGTSDYHKGWMLEPGKTMRCLLCSVEGDINDGLETVVVTEGMSDRVITCHNLHYGIPTIGGYYLAHLINGVYIIDHQICFEEFL